MFGFGGELWKSGGGSFGSTLTFAVSARMEGACMERYSEVMSFGKMIGRKAANRAAIDSEDCPRRAVSSFHGCQQETYAYV